MNTHQFCMETVVSGYKHTRHDNAGALKVEVKYFYGHFTKKQKCQPVCGTREALSRLPVYLLSNLRIHLILAIYLRIASANILDLRDQDFLFHPLIAVYKCK